MRCGVVTSGGLVSGRTMIVAIFCSDFVPVAPAWAKTESVAEIVWRVQMESSLQVADNTGARVAKMIGVIGKRTRSARVGDVITAHIREAIPTASIKKGTVVKCVVVRTAYPIRRSDGSVLRFDGKEHSDKDVAADEEAGAEG